MVLTPPRPRVWPYLVALGMTLSISYGAWRLTHPTPRHEQHGEVRPVRYVPNTLPEESVSVTLREEEAGVRTVILLEKPQGGVDAWGVYATPRGVRVGRLDQYYATLNDEEKLRLLVKLGHDLPRLARYAYADYTRNWPRVREDLERTLEYILNQTRER